MVTVRITRSARRHRISNRFMVEAMADGGDPIIEGDALVFIGRDSRGVELEIVAVPDNRNEGGLAVIHAMPTSFRRK